tara:strand:- start:1373 stop:2812 length:1440 start_codon:yes stop_codon:yes gene_type:complete
MGKQYKVIGYCRLSLEEKDQGSSMASQRSEIASHVERLGLKGDLEFLEDDGWSGASKRRPAFNRLKKMVDAGEVSAVVVRSQDRLGRNLRDFLNFAEDARDQGVFVYSVFPQLESETAAGWQTMKMQGLISDAELSQISARQVFSQKERRKQGRSIGPPLYGFAVEHRSDGAFRVIKESEAKFVREAAQIVVDGGSILAAAKTINGKGSRTRRGGLWISSNLGDLLRNPGIAGMRHHRGELTTDSAGAPIIDKHLQILTVAQWRKVQAALEKRKAARTKVEGTVTEQLLLRGIAKCAGCGSNMNRDSYPNRFGTRVPLYRCPKGLEVGCPAPSGMAAHLLDDFVIAYFEPVFDQPVIARVEHDNAETVAERERLAMQIDTISEKLRTADRDQIVTLSEQLMKARDAADSLNVETVTEYVEMTGTNGEFIEEHPRQFLSTWVDQVLVTKGSRHEPIADRIEIILKPIEEHPWADVFRVKA